jgi:hypothetical protein
MSAGPTEELPQTQGSSAGTPGILAIWNDREDSIADVYERWYLSEHLPERLGVPGFVAARRYEAAKGSPRFFTSYDVESVDVLSSKEYLERLAAPSELTRRVMAHFRNMVRTVCVPAYRSRGSTLGGCVVAGYVEQPARVDGGRLLGRVAELERDPRVLGAQVWRAAHDPAHASTSEAKLRPGGDRRIEVALVVDVLREDDGRALEATIRELLDLSVVHGRESVPVHVDTYRLLGQWRAPATDRGPR